MKHYLTNSNLNLAQVDELLIKLSAHGYQLHTLAEHTHNPGKYYLVLVLKAKVKRNGILRRLSKLRSHIQ